MSGQVVTAVVEDNFGVLFAVQCRGELAEGIVLIAVGNRAGIGGEGGDTAETVIEIELLLALAAAMFLAGDDLVVGPVIGHYPFAFRPGHLLQDLQTVIEIADLDLALGCLEDPAIQTIIAIIGNLGLAGIVHPGQQIVIGIGILDLALRTVLCNTVSGRIIGIADPHKEFIDHRYELAVAIRRKIIQSAFCIK